LKHPNYTKWKAFFRSMCGKFGILGYIDGTTPAAPDDVNWQMVDSYIRN
jgi:hypothetical protein